VTGKSFSLKNRVAIVTGGAQGIGFAIAEQLAEMGANLVIADINLEGAKRAAAELSQKYNEAIGVEVDVSKAEQTEKMAKLALEKFGKIDILVNNAGVVIRKGALETTDDEWDWIFSINIMGAVHSCQAVVQHFKENKYGRIINICTAQVGVVEPLRGAYITMKTGLMGLTNSLAVELAQFNITVNAVGPGWTKTEINQKALDGDQKTIDYITSKMPMARLAETEEVASLVGYLSTDLASYLTGQMIYVDGGWTSW